MRLLASIAVLCASMTAPTAFAEPGPSDARAAARQHFQRGVQAAAHADYAAAVEHFEAARQLRSAPNIVFNLASALFELGRHLDAHNALASIDLASAGEDVRSRASALAAAVRSELAWLSIHGVDPTLRLRVDGEERPWSDGRAIPLMPGPHAVEVDSAGRALLARTLELEAGVRFELDVVRDAPAPAPPPQAARGATLGQDVEHEPREDEAHSRRQGFIALGVTAGVIVAAGIAVPLLVRARSGDGGGDEPPPTSGFAPGVVSW